MTSDMRFPTLINDLISNVWMQPQQQTQDNFSRPRTAAPAHREPSPLSLPNIPTPPGLSPHERVQFKYWSHSGCFCLVDDSASMKNIWSQTRDTLVGVGGSLSSMDRQGTNVRFLHHPQVRSYRAKGELWSALNSVGPTERGKAMTPKVERMFQESLSEMDRTQKPVVLLILTDGIPSDAQQLLAAIARFSKKLDERRIPSYMFRLHVVQMGNDGRAAKSLRDFSDRVAEQDGNRDMFNAISYHPGRGPLDADKIVKLLVASTHIPDDEDPDLSGRQRPEVVALQYAAVDRLRSMGPRW